MERFTNFMEDNLNGYSKKSVLQNKKEINKIN